jgi:hypothetical protein
MWLPDDVIAAVDRYVRIHYVNVHDCKQWNEHRRDGELRLLTGWTWTAKNGASYRQGFKTRTVCYRDAWYAMVRKSEAPPIARPRLRVVTVERRSA